MNAEEICLAAIALYGRERQEMLCIEECAELIQAINKKHRGKPHNIAEEIADVEITLFQMKRINECVEEVERIKEEKIQRLAAKISSGRI